MDERRSPGRRRELNPATLEQIGNIGAFVVPIGIQRWREEYGGRLPDHSEVREPSTRDSRMRRLRRFR